jgi:tRNA-modifying protein YgfZ
MNTAKNIFVPDIQCDLLLVSGKDSRRFLQGQLSCDLNRLTDQVRLRGALCSLKGRVISDVQLWQHDDDIILQCPQGMAEKIRGSLAKYQVFFKTDIQAVSSRFQCLGVNLSDPQQLQSTDLLDWPPQADQVSTQPGFKVVRIHSSHAQSARFELLLESGHSNTDRLLRALSADFLEREARDWRLLDILDGIAHVRPGQEESFTPQLLGYDLDGTIDFKKGCYTGQEVVARMYYRAEAKRRPGYLVLQHDEPVEHYGINPLSDIIDMQETPTGERHYLLVVSTRNEQRHDRIRLFAD